MRDVIKSLEWIVEEWIASGPVPEIDWARMRSLDFQEVLRSRNELTARLNGNVCVSCDDFEQHVSDCIYISLACALMFVVRRLARGESVED